MRRREIQKELRKTLIGWESVYCEAKMVKNGATWSRLSGRGEGNEQQQQQNGSMDDQRPSSYNGRTDGVPNDGVPNDDRSSQHHRRHLRSNQPFSLSVVCGGGCGDSLLKLRECRDRSMKMMMKKLIEDVDDD